MAALFLGCVKQGPGHLKPRYCFYYSAGHQVIRTPLKLRIHGDVIGRNFAPRCSNSSILESFCKKFIVYRPYFERTRHRYCQLNSEPCGIVLITKLTARPKNGEAMAMPDEVISLRFMNFRDFFTFVLWTEPKCVQTLHS